MKKTKYLILIVLIFVFFLIKFVNWDYKNVKLPNPDKLIKIDLIENYDKTIYSIKYQMLEFIDSIKKNTKYTGIQSISDIPMKVDKFIVIKFYHIGDNEENPSYGYIYEKDDKKYFEQPFVGVWELSDDLYYRILNKKLN